MMKDGLPALSLRLRLWLWTVLVFAVVQVALAVVLMALGSDQRAREFSERLERRAHAIVASLTDGSGRPWSHDELASLVSGLSGSGFLERYFVAVRSADGKVIAHTYELDPDLVPVPRPLEEPTWTTLRPEPEGGTPPVQVRALAVPFRDLSGNPFVLQIVTSAPPTTDLAALLAELFLFTLPVGLIAAGIAAWRLAGRAVAPIAQLARAAHDVRPSNLERGIDVGPVDREVAKLQRELNDALQRLEDGYRAQETFLSDVSHELKTPISVLLSEAQALARRNPTADDLRRFTRSVEEEMRRLAALVEGLLTLARAERAGLTHLRRERINVNDLALGALEACLPLARELGVRVVPHLYDGDDVDVSGDPELLRTMVTNLLRNGLQFSPAESSVDIDVDVRGEQVELSIRDRGPGLPHELDGRLFRRFQQIPTPRRGGNGNGLGLAIALTIAQRHGGQVEVRNAPGGGCKAIAILPLATPASTPLEIPPQPPRDDPERHELATEDVPSRAATG
jgi:two-component system OmpR family sensor kinase